MKKIISFLLFSMIVLCGLFGCSGPSDVSQSEVQSSSSEKAESSETIPSIETIPSAESSTAESVSDPEPAVRKLKMTIAAQTITIVLYDTPTADALYEILPMELIFSDYNGTEKIAYPPETLPTEGEPDGCDPEAEDLCLYAPWGNLCIFYQDFRYSESLIKLGHVESGMDILAGMSSDFTAVLERTE